MASGKLGRTAGDLGIQEDSDAVYPLIPTPKWRISGSASGRWMHKLGYARHSQIKVS